MKLKKQSKKIQEQTISIPGGTIIIGVGSVPSSTASVSRTNIQELMKMARKASSLGTFSTENGF